MLLEKFAKFANWPTGNSPAQKVSEGLCFFFAKPNPFTFIGKYYNYDVDTNSQKFSKISMPAVPWEALT